MDGVSGGDQLGPRAKWERVGTPLEYVSVCVHVHHHVVKGLHLASELFQRIPQLMIGLHVDI